jgi:hypothetical protein
MQSENHGFDLALWQPLAERQDLPIGGDKLRIREVWDRLWIGSGANRAGAGKAGVFVGRRRTAGQQQQAAQRPSQH